MRRLWDLALVGLAEPARPILFAVGSLAVMPKPADGGSQPDLLSVVAFGSASVYAIGSDRRIRFFDGTAWQPAFTATCPLFDITGKSPDDLWVVGAGSYALNWYE